MIDLYQPTAAERWHAILAVATVIEHGPLWGVIGRRLELVGFAAEQAAMLGADGRVQPRLCKNQKTLCGFNK